MIRIPYSDFRDIEDSIREMFLDDELARPVDVGQWHSLDVSDQPALVSYELRHILFEMFVPTTVAPLKSLIRPNLPWAEDHFRERVSGFPLNPGEEYKNWPWYRDDLGHRKDGKFSHSYMERFWPKGAYDGDHNPGGFIGESPDPMCGLRYRYGDLDDVVALLLENPATRQAYLPVWFPEDTGAVPGERVPCTLGYHFLIREHQMHITYLIRSCDFMRYFNDDVYMACRLGQWICDKLNGVREEDTWVETLSFMAMSLHIMKGDLPKLERDAQQR